MPDTRRLVEADARPRLLVLASTYPRWPGDPEPGFVHELAKRLAGRFRVVVLGPHAPGAKRRESMDGVEVVRYRYAPAALETLVNDGGIVTNLKRSRWKLLLVPAFVLAQAWAAWRIARRDRIDVIHAHWLLPQGLIAALLQSLPGRKVPFVVTSHGADLYALRGKALAALKRFVLRRCAAATVVSSAMLESLRGIGAPTVKVSVLSMGVDVSGRFKPDSTIERSGDEILFVGRLVEKKGVAHLIRALPRVLAQRPSVRLTIAGFGPYEAQLRTEALAAGVAAHVDFLGALPQSRLPELYQRAGVFVAPFVRADSGDQEGLPVALMEAIACGCPILAGDVAGLHDMLGEHAHAVVFDPFDEDGLADRIVATLADPHAAGERALGMGAHVRQRFDWENIAARYGAILAEAASP
jgi:glycosyltransferase involved in cell wall biosynthesis